MVQVEKLRKIGKNSKNFRINHDFEANIIAQAENIRNLLTWPERAFTCGSFFENLNCLGEIGLEKNSRNFYKCRGMSRFGEKKHRRDGMSRLGTSRNVQWSADVVTNSLCSRTHNLVNLSSLRWRYFDQRTKKMKEIFFWEKWKNVFLAETRRRHTSWRKLW